MSDVVNQASGVVRGSFRGRRGGGRPWRGRGKIFHEKTRRTSERPTHFVSVPLDHIQDFTSQVSHLTNALLAVSPPIAGLDPSIVISPPRLHLTLGVMNLTEDNAGSEELLGDTGSQSIPLEAPKTVSQAVSLLQSLQPEIQAATNNEPLQLSLDEIAVMRQSRDGEADVMYVGPAAATPKTEQHLRSVGALETVYRRFREAGFITDTRPLKLHCTILNTSHRKPASRGGRRVPFSMVQIEDEIARNPGITGTLLTSNTPLMVREINICRMGSWDPLGRYVRVGSVGW